VTIATATFLLILVCGIGVLALMAVRDNRRALGERLGLLDDAGKLFEEASVTQGADGFPVLKAMLPDGRSIAVEIIPDTLVCRRLPQLWLRLTVRHARPYYRPTIGALSRATGAEFYSIVHEMPDRLEIPLPSELPLLVRGRGPRPTEIDHAAGVLRKLFGDPLMKEVAITSEGVRIVRRIAEGSRGAHILLRQAKFAVRAVPARFLMETLSAAEDMAMAFETEGPVASERIERVLQ